jgi:hypothetical protein
VCKTGNFWHNRQMVFDEVATYIKEALPKGTVSKVKRVKRDLV